LLLLPPPLLLLPPPPQLLPPCRRKRGKSIGFFSERKGKRDVSKNKKLGKLASLQARETSTRFAAGGGRPWRERRQRQQQLKGASPREEKLETQGIVSTHEGERKREESKAEGSLLLSLPLAKYRDGEEGRREEEKNRVFLSSKRDLFGGVDFACLCFIAAAVQKAPRGARGPAQRRAAERSSAAAEPSVAAGGRSGLGAVVAAAAV
jgi:hypothetical protein